MQPPPRVALELSGLFAVYFGFWLAITFLFQCQHNPIPPNQEASWRQKYGLPCGMWWLDITSLLLSCCACIALWHHWSFSEARRQELLDILEMLAIRGWSLICKWRIRTAAFICAFFFTLYLHLSAIY
ncbi:unnamed protein product, partial [Mesorhabditis spiculigera]